MADTLQIEPPDFQVGTFPSCQGEAARKERRSKPRRSYEIMLPMAPWDSEATGQFANLQFTTVRCLDLSDGGVAIVLPVLPSFTHAVFSLMLQREPANLLARVKDIVEGAYNGEHQFRVGFQFRAVLARDGTLGPMPAK